MIRQTTQSALSQWWNLVFLISFEFSYLRILVEESLVFAVLARNVPNLFALLILASCLFFVKTAAAFIFVRCQELGVAQQ